MHPLLPLLIVCAALAVLSAPWALDLPLLNFVFKPAATLVVIAHAWRRGAGMARQRRWVLVGLVCSLAGDVALLWPQQGFLPGLVSFLMAHLAYLVAFTRSTRLAARPLPFVAYALVAGVILWRLWPGVPAALQAPVVAYVVCLAAMAAQAAVVWRCGAQDGAGLAHGGAKGDAVLAHGGAQRDAVLALGGALFMASDTLLAINKFATALPLASLWILATYWGAQWCIASWLKPAPP